MKMCLIDMAAWVVHYLLLAFQKTESWMVDTCIFLKGICYSFFFVTGQFYTNEKIGQRFRSLAHGVITFTTYVVGMLVVFCIAGFITKNHTTSHGHLWINIWLIPAAISLGVLEIFTLLFKEDFIVRKFS